MEERLAYSRFFIHGRSGKHEDFDVCLHRSSSSYLARYRRKMRQLFFHQLINTEVCIDVEKQWDLCLRLDHPASRTDQSRPTKQPSSDLP